MPLRRWSTVRPTAIRRFPVALFYSPPDGSTAHHLLNGPLALFPTLDSLGLLDNHERLSRNNTDNSQVPTQVTTQAKTGSVQHPPCRAARSSCSVSTGTHHVTLLTQPPRPSTLMRCPVPDGGEKSQLTSAAQHMARPTTS